MLGYKFDRDVVERLRDKRKGKPSPKKGKPSGVVPWNKGAKGLQVAWNKGLLGYCAGKIISQETKMAISNAQKNKTVPLEVKNKLSSSLKSYFQTEKGILQIQRDIELKKGNKYHLGHKHSANTIEKLKKPKTEEHKAKLRKPKTKKRITNGN